MMVGAILGAQSLLWTPVQAQEAPSAAAPTAPAAETAKSTADAVKPVAEAVRDAARPNAETVKPNAVTVKPAAAAAKPVAAAAPMRVRRHRPVRRRPRVAGLPLARPATATNRNLAPGGSLDTRASAPKWGLLGNLGGIRDDLYRGGVRVDAGLDYEGATNLQGGTRGQLVRGSGQFFLRATADMNQLAGIEGGTATFILTDRFGRSLPIDANLGVLQQTEEVYGRGNIPRLTTLSYDQQFGQFVDLKFGRLPVSADFAGFACEFQNLTFCGSQPGNIVGNYWYSWPVSQYAGRLRIGNLNTGYIQAGLYQVNRRDLEDGFNFDPSHAKGALALLEAAFFPTFGPNDYRGSYTVGGWYQTAGGPDLYYNTAKLPLSVAGGLPLAHQDRAGIYGIAVQELYRPDPTEPSRNLSAFVRLAFADPHTSAIDEQESIGLVYKGFWAARPLDWIGVAVGQSHASAALAKGIAAANAFYGDFQPIPGYERAVEVFYSLAVTPDVVVRPNIQFVNRPGGFGKREDVVVFGVKSGITF